MAIGNALNLVKADMAKHDTFSIVIPGWTELKDLALVTVQIEADMVSVYASTYDAEFTDFHRKVVEKRYGTNPVVLDFGVFFDGDTMVFAFCMDLVKFDRDNSLLVATPLEDALLEGIKPNDDYIDHILQPPKPARRRRTTQDSRSSVIMYGILPRDDGGGW